MASVLNKALISFWYMWELNIRSFIQTSEILLGELTETHYFSQ